MVTCHLCRLEIGTLLALGTVNFAPDMAFSTAFRRWPQRDLTAYSNSKGSDSSSSSSSSRNSSSSTCTRSRVLATSAASLYTTGKREYCADYKPLVETITLKNIGVQVAKAGVLTFATGMQEYNAYLDKLIAYQNAEDAKEKLPPVPDFDFGAARIKYWAMFTTSANRFVSTYVLRRLYESLAMAKLNARTADRLCKDVLKSLKRKLARSDRLRACANVVTTAFYANATIYAAALTYDVLTYVPATVRMCFPPAFARVFRLKPGHLLTPLLDMTGDRVGEATWGPHRDHVARFWH